MEAKPCIRLSVWRFDPETAVDGYFQEYEVETAEELSIMTLLAKVHEMDASFACRTSVCFKGLCGSCLIRCNGQDVLGCKTLVRPGESVRLEPHSKFRVIRDVAVDFAQPLPGTEKSGVAPCKQ